jgi:hypothetical protein
LHPELDYRGVGVSEFYDKIGNGRKNPFKEFRDGSYLPTRYALVLSGE